MDEVEYECQYCHRIAVGTMRVPEVIHPDEHVVVCEEHYDFIHNAYLVFGLWNVGIFVLTPDEGPEIS